MTKFNLTPIRVAMAPSGLRRAWLAFLRFNRHTIALQESWLRTLRPWTEHRASARCESPHDSDDPASD